MRHLSDKPDGEQLLFVNDWNSIPGPKILRADKKGPFSWTRIYTGFSEPFARHALRLLAGKSSKLVLDPFVGAGTTLVAGTRVGLGVVGADLDPVSALLARATAATNFEAKELSLLLAPGNCDKAWRGSSESQALFGPRDLNFARTVFDRVEQRIGACGDRLWQRLISCQDGRDTEALAIASLLTAADGAAAVVRGSNPVWFRAAGFRPPRRLARLDVSANHWARKIADDVEALDQPHEGTRVLQGDFRTLPIDAGSIDVVLTSPPYLNRVDYAQSHLAAIHLLSDLVRVDLERLRCQMMGTTKMTDKPAAADQWGPTCTAILRKIKAHPSKASDSYYHWFFSQYFRDTFELIEALGRLCKTGARGAVVLQNSYYKEIEIPLELIWMEMCGHFGIAAASVRSDIVKHHLGSLSPSQKKWLPSKILRETVLVLDF